jgi:hypothetical protein
VLRVTDAPSKCGILRVGVEAGCAEAGCTAAGGAEAAAASIPAAVPALAFTAGHAGLLSDGGSYPRSPLGSVTATCGVGPHLWLVACERVIGIVAEPLVAATAGAPATADAPATAVPRPSAIIDGGEVGAVGDTPHRSVLESLMNIHGLGSSDGGDFSGCGMVGSGHFREGGVGEGAGDGRWQMPAGSTAKAGTLVASLLVVQGRDGSPDASVGVTCRVALPEPVWVPDLLVQCPSPTKVRGVLWCCLVGYVYLSVCLCLCMDATVSTQSALPPPSQ